MLEKIYKAKNNKEVQSVYKEWAGDYDTDTIENLGYVAHVITADALDNALESRDVRILDAGCGTGLVGEQLVKKQYRNLDALDFSEEMLNISKRKNIYRRLFQADMNRPLDIETDCYDAVVCSGSFSYGHVEPKALNELVHRQIKLTL